MNKDITWGLFSQILPSISVNAKAEDMTSSPYYKLAADIFAYLSKHQRENGAIYDTNASSALNAQYHHANFGLSSVILYILNNNEIYYDRAFKAFKFYIDMPLEHKKGGIDFSNFPILLAYILLKNNDSKNILFTMLGDYIKKMAHHAAVDNVGTYGNNFVTLRALNHLLRFMLFEEDKDRELAYTFLNHSLKWQFEDGIFYDFPRSFNDEKGIPSLAYHSKITFITLLFGVISGDKGITDRALLGLDALVKLTADDGEAFYYGRTNNALYGYACGIPALRAAANYLKDGEKAEGFKACERALFQFSARHCAKDGHLYIVPNKFEEERCGFDNYMYVTVYNAFTMAMLLLSSLIKDTVKPDMPTEPRVDYFKDSGFFIKKGERISAAFNLKGHNYYEQYLLDPRFTCITPLFIKHGGSDILPTIPFSAPHYIQGRDEPPVKKIKRKISEAFLEIKKWSHLEHYNPLHAGFIPFLTKKNNLYLPLNIIKSDVLTNDNMLIIKCKVRFISVKSRGFRPFVLFIADAMRRYINVSDTYLKSKLLKETEMYLDRTIIIDDDFIHFHDRISGEIDGKVFFTLRTYLDGSTEIKDNRFQFEKDGSGFVLLLEEDEVIGQQKTLCSSKGKVCYLEITSKNSYLNKKKKNVIMKHTLIPFDKKHSVEEYIANFNSLSPLIGKYCV